jgi:hypothetical protein
LEGNTEPCLICDGLEQDQRVNRVVLGFPYIAYELQPQPDPDKRRTLLITQDPNTVKNLRWKPPPEGQTVGQVQVAFETSPNEADWKDKIATNACPPEAP